jgi:hypothetical protein
MGIKLQLIVSQSPILNPKRAKGLTLIVGGKQENPQRFSKTKRDIKPNIQTLTHRDLVQTKSNSTLKLKEVVNPTQFREKPIYPRTFSYNQGNFYLLRDLFILATALLAVNGLFGIESSLNTSIILITLFIGYTFNYRVQKKQWDIFEQALARRKPMKPSILASLGLIA